MDCCDIIWSADRRKKVPAWKGPIHPASLVYAKRDHANGLFKTLSNSRSRVAIVTAESDDHVSQSHVNQMPPQVAHWFSTNSCDERVTSIPLGLGNSYCEVTLKADAIATAVQKQQRRENLLYVNFRRETNVDERGPLMDYFIEQRRSGNWLTVRNGDVGPDQYLDEMIRHRFVLCPPGNGIDTHRLWEAVYAGSIPIVKRHKALDSFRDLPILFLDDLAIADPAVLEKEYQKIVSQDWNVEKLFIPWWVKIFLSSKKTLQTQGQKISISTFLVQLIKKRVKGLESII